MINSIINYIHYLESEHNFSISIHGKKLKNIKEKTAPFNIHRNPYCMYIKSSEEAWDRCVICQRNVLKKISTGTFFGLCYAGVGEYIVPVKDGDNVLGFISISGYKGDKSKMDKAVSEYGLSRSKAKQLYNTCLSDEIPDENLINQLITPLCAMIVLFCIKNPDNTYSDSSNYIYGHILTILHNEYMNRITIKNIAQRCHCSVSYISHLFKSKTGTTVNKYLTDLRISEAKKLLINSELSISEISDSTGFCDADYFIYVFGKNVGITPKKYRNQARH